MERKFDKIENYPVATVKQLDIDGMQQDDKENDSNP